ncbi:hypothetical protein EB354_04285 [Chryseobacterium balustinum]|uniref:Uncharacterized protein n=1 Tax=Chryseobacterium balustinum TaxID=246 RepID=A0AAX2IF15_9FLAO|nr:hypothetical protein [Chryseobacterium balustinum]AZB28543.1 hypothetical protein EB354_04285 [Chryseobacterium balustinum]SKB77021.1 hypothetical protein SAMN05421800_10836 [Chryseobacterium balustinum]SQA86626.1 Uncharacterised protein [Chryseobacterium balustinum]
MFFGTFDYIILTLIFIFNLGIWKYKIIRKRNWILYLIAFFLLGFIIPFFSMGFEINKATENEPVIDNFTLLYTYFRFPIWWFISAIEVFILRKITKK